jgi:hypothetical protein
MMIHLVAAHRDIVSSKGDTLLAHSSTIWEPWPLTTILTIGGVIGAVHLGEVAESYEPPAPLTLRR